MPNTKSVETLPGQMSEEERETRKKIKERNENTERTKKMKCEVRIKEEEEYD